jgi:hypothetical protein
MSHHSTSKQQMAPCKRRKVCCLIDKCDLSDVDAFTQVHQQEHLLPKFAPVMPPELSALPLNEKIQSCHQSLQKSAEWWEKTCRCHAKAWSNKALTYTLPNVCLETLAARGKNNQEDRDKAEEQMKKMEDWPTDACSGRWLDCEGKLLVAGFADQIINEVDDHDGDLEVS